MKKTTKEKVTKADRGPRTEQDERFLMLVSQIMKAERISSERAFSLEFGRGPDFISRIRRGIQSAPADAWDALLNKYPDTRNTTNVMSQGGQAIGVNHGTATQNHGTTPPTEAPTELATAHALIEQLKSQLTDKERLIASLEGTIASKEEIISLLRGGYNRPN